MGGRRVFLTYTDEQRALKAAVADLCKQYPPEYWRELDAKREYPERFIDELKAGSKDPAQQRLVGTGDDLGKLLGLDKDWSYRAIKAVGNYGEIFERNVGPKSVLKLPRGTNNLWNKGGLMYGLPVR